MSVPKQNQPNRFLHPLFQPPKGQMPIETFCASPVIIAIDPGSTTGWAVWQVHPEALSNPEVYILANIQYWEHGQVDCGAKRGNAGDSPARSATEILHAEAGQRVGDIQPIDLDAGSLAALPTGYHRMRAIQGGDTLGISSTGESAGVSELLRLVDGWPGAAIVTEDFILRKFDQGRDILAPVRVMEKFEFGLWVIGRYAQSFRQQPSMAKTTVTDERLRRWGFYRREGGMEHARDADRHAITFLRRCSEGKAGRALREIAWPYLYGTIETSKGRVNGMYRRN